MNVNYSILKYLGDTDKIRYLNWSKYILDHLVANKIYWDEHPTRYFPGSLLFLMLLYVDRFIIEEVRAQREIPILKGWTTNMLSTREKLEFFKGRIGSFGNNQPVAVSSGSKKPKMENSVPVDTENDKGSEPNSKKENYVLVDTENHKVAKPDPKKKCLMELASASINLVLAYIDFGKKHEAAIKHFPNNEKNRKLKDAMMICDEQKLHSKVINKGQGLSFSQDEEY